jgi:hypothetical protein
VTKTPEIGGLPRFVSCAAGRNRRQPIILSWLGDLFSLASRKRFIGTATNAFVLEMADTLRAFGVTLTPTNPNQV